MSSTPERAAADACPGDSTYSLATVTTHEVVVIPTADRGKWWSFASTAGSGDAVAVAIRFGTADTVEVDISKRTTLTSGALDTSTTEPHIIVPAGGEVHRRLQGEWTHFAHESSATTGALVFGPCQGAFGSD